jgi:hypothetical protein
MAERPPNFRTPSIFTALEKVEWAQLAIGAAALPLGFFAGVIAVVVAGAINGRSLASAPENLLIGVLVTLVIPLGLVVHAYATGRRWRGHGTLLALAVLVGGSILLFIAFAQAMASFHM